MLPAPLVPESRRRFMRRISNVKRPRRTPNSRRVAIFGIAFASVLVASACVNGARPRNADASTVTYTIFPSTATPKVKASTNVHSIEVGVRFSPKVAGYATGMRFYKGAGNTGPHVGTLWSSTKVVLARVTFAGESASGWQREPFRAQCCSRRGERTLSRTTRPPRQILVHVVVLHAFRSDHDARRAFVIDERKRRLRLRCGRRVSSIVVAEGNQLLG